MIPHLLDMISLFPHAIIGGVLIAATCAFLGVFVICKRVVFIGVTLAEVAACGIAAAMATGFSPFAGAVFLTLMAVLLLSADIESRRIPRDAVLGILFVLCSSSAILLVSKSGFGLHEVKTLLYGDLILTSSSDLKLLVCTLLPAVCFTLLCLRPVLYSFMDRDAAKVLDINVRFWEFFFFLALGIAISAASKTAGSLLVFCFLVIPPSTALLMTKRLWLVLPLAVTLAILSTLIGMAWSVASDLPTNQAIAAVSCFWLLPVILLSATKALAQVFHLQRLN